MTNLQRMKLFSYGIILSIPLTFAVDAIAETKAKPKTDCSIKKNASKIECKKAPTSDVENKAVVKKPEKIRKAPPSVQKKAEENTK